jgi:hypothetical protein
MLDSGYVYFQAAEPNVGVSHTKLSVRPLAHAKEMQSNKMVGRSTSKSVAYVCHYHISSTTRRSPLHVTTFFTHSHRLPEHNVVFTLFIVGPLQFYIPKVPRV